MMTGGWLVDEKAASDVQIKELDYIIANPFDGCPNILQLIWTLILKFCCVTLTRF